MLKNKEFYTAQELTELQITLLPKTVKGIIARAKKENWLSRPRSGRGGGLEYAFSGLPREVQIEIETQVTKALILTSTPTKKAVAIKQGRDTKTLSHKDRRCVDNRLLMALLVEQYTLELGSQDKALKFISSLSRNNALPTIGGTDYNVVCANAKASNHGTGVGVRKLHEWVLESKRCHTPTERLSMLAPAKQGRPKLDVMTIGWLPDFLAVYRNPNGLPFSKSYQIFAVNYVNVHGKDTLPSLNQVRKALNELPPVVRERGRKTGSQLKVLDAYIQRDWNAVHIKNNSNNVCYTQIITSNGVAVFPQGIYKSDYQQWGDRVSETISEKFTSKVAIFSRFFLYQEIRGAMQPAVELPGMLMPFSQIEGYTNRGNVHYLENQHPFIQPVIGLYQPWAGRVWFQMDNWEL